MLELTEELQKEKHIIEKAGKMHWLHWIIVVLSLILTLSAWYISKESIETKTKFQFDRQAEHVVELIYERMQKYEDGLAGGVAAIKMKGEEISSSDWKKFADNLRLDVKYPGINGIGVIYFIKPETLESFLAHQRETRPDFKIHPEHNRNEFWPIIYIEPIESNKKAVGLDMAHEENRYSAAVKARDTGKTQITGPITLVQDQNKTPGFLFYAPLYRDGNNETIEERQRNFIGMVYAPFVVKKLMKGTLQTEKRSVGLAIHDGSSTLYNEDEEGIAVKKALYSKKIELSLYGRIWVFDIWSKDIFHKNSESNQPTMILIGGILIDTLLLTLFMLLANANHRAIQFIRKIVADEVVQ